MFRSRFDAALRALGIPKGFYTPGGMRGGGAVAQFCLRQDIDFLMWKMRLQSKRSLEHYLQEVSATVTIKKLPVEAQNRVAFMCKHWDQFLQAAIGELQ